MRKTSAYARKHRRGDGYIKLPIAIRFNAQDEQDLQRKPHQMLKGFRNGAADEGDWHAITLRLNWGRMLSGEHFPDSVPQAEAGIEAIRAIKARHERTGKWGISQPEYDAIDWAIVFAIATNHIGDFERFARKVAERLAE